MVEFTTISTVLEEKAMRGLKRGHEKFLDKEQFAALVRAAKGNSYPQAADLFYSAGVLGLRIGEAITLNRDCFTYLERGVVEIETLKRFDIPPEDLKKIHQNLRDGKGSGKRLGKYPHLVLPVSVGPNVQAYCRQLLAKTPEKQRYLFPGRGRGSHISATHAERLFHQCAVAAGLGMVYSFHSLRHHKGVALWEKNKDREQIAAELRHSSVDTTKIYTHLSEKEKRELAAKVDADYNFAP
jgi:integrase